MRSIGPAVTREQSPAFLRNSNGRLDLPGPTQEAAWIPRSLPGSSAHWIFQARILELVAMPSSRGSSSPRNRTRVSCIAGGLFTAWANREASVLQWACKNGWLYMMELEQSFILFLYTFLNIPYLYLSMFLCFFLIYINHFCYQNNLIWY